MNELQFWHWIATGGVTALLTILWWWVRGVSDDMKTKLSREEFADFLNRTTSETTRSRQELRDSIIQLFAKGEAHEKLDASRFESVMKDFNGGISRLSEKISDIQASILTQLNNKVDRDK